MRPVLLSTSPQPAENHRKLQLIFKNAIYSEKYKTSRTKPPSLSKRSTCLGCCFFGSTQLQLALVTLQFMVFATWALRCQTPDNNGLLFCVLLIPPLQKLLLQIIQRIFRGPQPTCFGWLRNLTRVSLSAPSPSSSSSSPSPPSPSDESSILSLSAFHFPSMASKNELL